MYSKVWTDVKPLVHYFINYRQPMMYDVNGSMAGEVRQNGALRRLDVMHGLAVHNGQTVFVDIEPLF